MSNICLLGNVVACRHSYAHQLVAKVLGAAVYRVAKVWVKPLEFDTVEGCKIGRAHV